MNLVSFEKLAESDAVSDFISGLGKKIYCWAIENYLNKSGQASVQTASSHH